MRPAPLLFVALLVAVLGAPAGAAPAATPAAIHVDMYPGDAGNDETAPGTQNGAFCNENLTDFDARGYGAWQAADHDSVNSVNLICATVLDGDDAPIPGEQLTLTLTGSGVITDRNGPAPQLTSETVPIGQDGFARFYIFGTSVGSLQLSWSAGPAHLQTQETWDIPDPSEARLIACTPDHAAADPGQKQDLTCTLTDGLGNPIPGVTVSWSASDADGASSAFGSTTTTTDAVGKVKAQIASSEPGTTTVRAMLDASASECDAKADKPSAYDKGKPVGDCTRAMTLTWNGPVPTQLGLSPDPVTAPQFTKARVTAMVTDAAGHAARAVRVRFAVRGANDLSRTVLTGTDGAAALVYEGERSGQDTISAYADLDGDGTHDPSEPANTSRATWSPACPGFGDDPRTQIVGTPGRDRLHGTRAFDILCGLGGNDVITGNLSGDLILGGAGDDRLEGGAGADILRGGAGNDELSGGDSFDRLFGGAGRDLLLGGDQADILRGGLARDVLFGGPGFDDMEGGPDRDTLDGGPGDDKCADSRDRQTSCEG